MSALTYEVRVDYADGTFEVMTVAAGNIAEAIDEADALALPNVAGITVLCTIDGSPQQYLAGFEV